MTQNVRLFPFDSRFLQHSLLKIIPIFAYTKYTVFQLVNSMREAHQQGRLLPTLYRDLLRIDVAVTKNAKGNINFAAVSLRFTNSLQSFCSSSASWREQPYLLRKWNKSLIDKLYNGDNIFEQFMSKEGVAVGIRIRPLLPQEQIDGNRVTINNNHKIKQFAFQNVFDRTVSQQHIFEMFALPLVEDLFKGYNCCLIAYGQNKSGKTFTMCGKDSQESKGMIPRIVDHINCKLYSQQQQQRRLMLRVSYIDIFQEEVIDLLTIRKGVNIEIIEGKDKQTTLKNIQMKSVGKVQDIETHFILGNRKRQLAYSKKYRNSEQSSSVFTLCLESIDSQGKTRKGKLDIVQLQAFDRINRFQPVLVINQRKTKQYDLSANSFKNVINGLIYGQQDSQIPYNDSKLTKILRNSLGGSSKTKILFHIYPISKCYDAIISTLRTASACQLIQNTPSYNFTDNCLIQQVIEQQSEFRSSLAVLQENIKQLQGESIEQQNHQQVHQQGEQNQFLSQSVLRNKLRQQRQANKEKLNKQYQAMKKKLNNIQSLFLVLEPLKNKHQIAFFKENYQSALQRLSKVQPINPLSLYQSSQNWTNSQTSFKKLNEKQRFYKQQVYDLQREFQKQRQLLLNTLREVTQKYKFFEKVAQRAVKKQEIDLLKMNSKYDETKRSYQIPLFAIRDKKISHSSRFFSPQQAHMINSRSISQRKFMMSQLSPSKLKMLQSSGKQYHNKVTQIKHIVSQEHIEDNPYFQKVPKIKKEELRKSDQTHKMSEDQYQMVRSSAMSNRLKKKKTVNSQKSPGPSFKGVKPIISPRFKFK